MLLQTGFVKNYHILLIFITPYYQKFFEKYKQRCYINRQYDYTRMIKQPERRQNRSDHQMIRKKIKINIYQ